MNNKKVVVAFIFLTFTILGIITLVPNSSAHNISHLGYYAVCSFAPFSTVILFILSAATYIALRKTA